MPESAAAMNVLYVDGCAADAAQAAAVLAQVAPPYAVEIVATWHAAVARLDAARRLDAVVCALDLSDGPGHDLVAHLRARAPGVPVVVLLAPQARADALGALRAGADDYLVKGPDAHLELPAVLEKIRRDAAHVREAARLREAEARLRLFDAALDATGCAFVITDRNAVIEWASPAFEALTGYSTVEALGHRPGELVKSGVHPPGVYEALWQTVLSHHVWRGELVNRRKDGRRYHESLTITPVLDEAGELRHFVAVKRDITERKLAREVQLARTAVVDELAAACPLKGILEGVAARLEKIWDGVRIAILLVDPHHRRLVQGAAPSLPGFYKAMLEGIAPGPASGVCARAAWLGETVIVEDIEHHPDCAAYRDVARRAGVRACWSVPFKDEAGRVLGTFGIHYGEARRPSDGELALVDEFARLSGLAVRRTRDAAERLEAEQRFRAAFEQSDQLAGVLSADGRVLMANRHALDIIAATPAEVIGRPFWDTPWWRGDPVQQARLRQAVACAAAGEGSGFEAVHRAHDGRVITVAFRASPIRIGDETQILVIGNDISRRKRMETELRRREQALEMAAVAALDLLRATDPDGAVHEVLARLGAEIGADRVCVFQNRLNGGGRPATSTLRHEWANAEVAPRRCEPQLRELSYADVAPRWIRRMERGLSVRGAAADFPDGLRGLLERHGIVSLLAVPINLHGRFWGFLSFDSVSARRDWSGAELSVLRIVAASLGAAIERKRALDELRLSAAVVDSTQDGVVIAGLDGRILAVNRAYSEITGYAEPEILGKKPGILSSGRHDAAFYQAMWASIIETGHWQGELWNRRKNGEIFPEWLSISTVRDDQGAASHYVGVFTDISQIKRSEAELEHLAHYDPLTGLPNRLLLYSRLQHAIDTAQRNGHQLALLMLDLDHFKDVNDSFGHPVGDELLTQVAERLRSRLRSADTLARLGGDEFTVLLEGIVRLDDVARVAAEIIAVFDHGWSVANGTEVRIGTSVGISLYPSHGQSAADLLQQADTALYLAKAEGRGCFRYFSDHLTTAVRDRIAMEAGLRRALEHDELRVFFQPQLDAKTGRIIGAEALVRWQDPVEGLIPPARFIPVAEQTGLIGALGAWVLRETCRQGVRWIQAGFPPLSLAVNLSANQFVHGDIVDTVSQVLAETGFPAARLELEITESVLMTRQDEAIERLGRLRALGVRLAIDDFGTGYSSLAYLKRFPLDVLKIDKSFVDGLPHDQYDAGISRAVVAIGHSLGFKVLAEGVEKAEQLEFLCALGCDMYQGYFASRPVPAAAFTALLEGAEASG